MFINLKIAIKRFLQSRFSLWLIKNKNFYGGLSKLSGIDLFVDIGANHGQFGPKIAELANLSIQRAVLVEPDTRCLTSLRKTEGFYSESCTVINKCVTSEKGPVKFHFFEDSALNSLSEGDVIGSASHTVMVECISGEEIMRGSVYSENEINLLKVDVQGAEEQVLKSFGDSLSLFDFVIIEVSFFPYYKNQTEFSTIMEILDTTHQYCGALGEVYGEDGALKYMNATFKRRKLI